MAGPRSLLGPARRPGARPARDEGRERAAGALGRDRERPRRDPRLTPERRGLRPGPAGAAGAGARRAARAGTPCRAVGVDRGSGPGAPEGRPLGAGGRAAGVQRRPRCTALVEGARRHPGAVGGNRAQRPRAHAARALVRADETRRPSLGPRGFPAGDRDPRHADAVGGHAWRGPRRGRGRPRGAYLGPHVGAAERRRDGSRRAEGRRGPPRALGRHAHGGGAARSRRGLSELVPARGGPDAFRTRGHGALDRRGSFRTDLPRHPARRRATDTAPGAGRRGVRERALRRGRRPAERHRELDTAPRLEGTDLDRHHRRHRAPRPRPRGGLCRAKGPAADRAGAGHEHRAPDRERRDAPVRRPRRAVRIRPAHPAPGRRRALSHPAGRLRLGRLGVGRGNPEGLHQPARARLPVPRRGPRRRGAALGAGRARVLGRAQPMAPAVGHRAAGPGAGRAREPARARARARAAAAGRRGSRRWSPSGRASSRMRTPGSSS